MNAEILANGQGVAPSSGADGAICAYLHSQESREHMKIGRLARNVILVGLAWRLIARRRDALARERRVRRIAPLLITAGGTGVILVARPRILESARRLWDVARRQSGSKTSNVASEPQRDAREDPPGGARRVIASSAKPRPGRSQEGKQEPRPLPETEPKPRVKKSRKRVAHAEQSEKGRHKSSYGVKGESKDRSESGESLKH